MLTTLFPTWVVRKLYPFLVHNYGNLGFWGNYWAGSWQEPCPTGVGAVKKLRLSLGLVYGFSTIAISEVGQNGPILQTKRRKTSTENQRGAGGFVVWEAGF